MVWETNAPIPVAGFNLGNFKTQGDKTPDGFGVDAYADVGLPDQFNSADRMRICWADCLRCRR